MARDVDRWAFLAGEGSLTVAEVVDWAKELGYEPMVPGDIDRMEPLMVAVVAPGRMRWRERP